MNQRTGASRPVLFWGALAVIVVAPMVWGGNRPWPLLLLELAGLALLVMMAWSREVPLAPPTLRWGIALLVVIPLLQLLPVPPSWWAHLPGHAPYASVLDAAGANEGWRSITIHRRATEYAWLALIPCVAIFFAVQCLGRRSQRELLLAFAAVVLGESLLGVLQAGAGKESLVVLGNPWGGGAASGTYINKNHFAGLMVMGLPIVLAFWAGEVLPQVDRVGQAVKSHPRHADAQMARRIGWSLLVVVVLGALAFTRSRAGIGCGLLVFAIAGSWMILSTNSRSSRAILAAIAACVFLLAAYVGLAPVLERFAAQDLSLSYANRLGLAAAALRGACEFFPLGSGLGTFADVFLRYQPEGIVGFVDHAHNDYAEALLELGLGGAAIIVLFAYSYVRRWTLVAPQMRIRSMGLLQAAAGLSVLALGIHGMFDFNFHIPANAIYFSFLAGVFFYDPPG